MSYDIHFIKTPVLTAAEVEDLLESDLDESDGHFISWESMQEITQKLRETGVLFELFESPEKEYLELNFESFQLGMFRNELALSVPFWEVNESGETGRQLQKVISTLIRCGFTAYDPQLEELITNEFELGTLFHEVRTATQHHATDTSWQPDLKYICLALAIVIIVITAWNLLT